MKSVIKPFLLIGLFLGLINTTTAALPEVIKIGSDTSYAPYEWIDADGTAKGFEVELVYAMCQHLGVKCEFVSTDFDGLIPSLKSEKVDMLVSALAMTEKRERQIAFSDKMFNVAPRLIAPKGSDLQPTPDSLRGKNIGVEQGTTQESYANAIWRSQGVNVISYQNQHLVYGDLVAGRLDAALQDQVAGEEGFLKQENGKNFAFTGPEINDTKYFGVGTGFGFRKGDDELREAFNKALIALRADGTYQAIAAKYFDFDVYGD